MNFFNFDFKKAVFFILVLALPLVSINMQQKPQESQWMTQPLSLLASFVQESFFNFSYEVRKTTALYIDLIGIKKDSSKIKHQNEELLSRLNLMEELRSENNRLRKLLNFKESTQMDLIGAQVIGRDLLPDHNTLTINKGTSDGIKSGMGVLSTSSILGYIFRPEKFTSQIMLITDRYSVVDGVIARSRTQGIVEGKGGQGMSLKYVEKTADVKVGDLVLTGGLDNIFPKGFPLALVSNIERGTFSISLKVDLKPVIDPRLVEEVFIISAAKMEDLTPHFAPSNSIPETDLKVPEPSSPSPHPTSPQKPIPSQQGNPSL